MWILPNFFLHLLKWSCVFYSSVIMLYFKHSFASISLNVPLSYALVFSIVPWIQDAINRYLFIHHMGLASLMAQTVNNRLAMWETWVWPVGWGRSPGGKHGNLLQYSCLENLHGLRSLAGYSPQGHKELDTTAWLNTAHTSYTCDASLGVQW